MIDAHELLTRWRMLLSDYDLVSVINSQFRDSRILDHRLVEYGPEGAPAVRVHYRKHDLDALEFLESEPTSTVQAIEAAIQVEAESTGNLVCRAVVFTSVAVRGSWHHPWVRITHLPEDAPNPGMVVGRWPFYLEYEIRDSSDPFLRARRERVRLVEVASLLNALVHFGISLPARSSEHEWVLEVRRRPLSVSTMYAQVGYHYDDPRVEDVGTYIPVPESESLSTEPHPVHFARFGIDGNELTVPATLGSLIDTYLNLPTAEREAFRRACYWNAFASEVEIMSTSAATAARVQAIEALLPHVAVSHCPSCGSVIGPSVREQFLHFLRDQAPGISDAELQDLYTQRSKILHGGDLLEGDLSPGFAHLSPRVEEEHRLSILSFAVTQRVLVNWLGSRAAPPIPPVVGWRHQQIGGLRQVRATVGPAGPAQNSASRP